MSMKSTQTTQKCTFIYVTLLFLLALLFLPLISSAQTTVPFEKRYETSGINGDLTIIGKHEAAGRRRHGLGASGAQVDDGKPSVTQCNAGLRVDPDPLAVRTAVAQSACHARG